MFQSQFMPQQESSFVYPNIPAENPGSGGEFPLSEKGVGLLSLWLLIPSPLACILC